MNVELPEKLRDYIRSINPELASRADMFWQTAQPILDRQSRVDSNENGFSHVEMVELNAWRLIKDSGKKNDFKPFELFILSCAACCHDFDKGLCNMLPDGVGHGEGSGAFLTEESKVFLQSFHEAVAIEKIIGIHAHTTPRFEEELKSIETTFSLSKGPVPLKKLAVILKTADILHTDSSRIPLVGIDETRLTPDERNKKLARESISGWHIKGDRIIVNATPRNLEHLKALEGCMTYIKDNEWITIKEKLEDYGFPYELEFKIDLSKCGKPEPTEKEEEKTPGSRYSQKHFVFNVPYRQKGDGVVGRAEALQKLRDQLIKNRGTAIGQAASFHGMGGLGKTQLAVEYAHKYKDSYPYGVIWISADQDIEAQLIQISLNGLWIAPESEHKIILDTAKRRIVSYSGCLIIFDNVEDVETIKPYLPEPSASPHLILTSRKPVAGFEPIAIDILNKEDYLTLLMMESGRNHSPLSQTEAKAAESIVTELGGLPLAIEIAGACLKYTNMTFDAYLEVLKTDFQSALAGEMMTSFTGHESDLYRTLKVSETLFKHEPLLEDILDVLTLSGSSFMGLPLLSALLDTPVEKLHKPLSFGVTLRLLRKDESCDRYEIHRLLKKVRKDEFNFEARQTWVETLCSRIGDWFQVKREDFADLAEFESEFDHLKQWQDYAVGLKSVESARLLWLQAYPPYHWGIYAISRRILTSAMELYEELKDDVSELKAYISEDLSVINARTGNDSLALDHAKDSLEIREKLLGPDRADTATSLDIVGTSYRSLGRYDKALEYQKRALEIRKKCYGPDHKLIATSLNNVGLTYRELGERAQSMELFEQAHRILKKSNGPDHPAIAAILSNIGVTYGSLGNHDKALEFLEQASKIIEKSLGLDHPKTASILANIGDAYGAFGNHDKALKFQEQALGIREKTLGPEHPDTALSLNNLSKTYADLGHHGKAMEYYFRAFQILEKRLGPENPKTITAINNVVFEQFHLKKYSEAYTLLNRFLAKLPKTHPEYGELVMLRDNADRQCAQRGFRPPSVVLSNKKKKSKKNR